MEDANRAEPLEGDGKPTLCTLKGCTGQYEKRRVLHTVRSGGRVIVIDNVPADVCDVCGDVLFDGATVRRIEAIIERASGEAEPSRTVPLYEYT